MGQRLNLEIQNQGEVLANSYYHWSAYTGSAYYLTEQVVSFMQSNWPAIGDKKLLAIKALESTGAGMGKRDLAFAYSHQKWQGIEFKECKNRNDGILSILKSTIKDTQDWAEGNVYIDIAYPPNPEITFTVFSYWESAEFYLSEMCSSLEEENEFKSNLVKTKYKDDTFHIKELKEAVDDILSGKILEFTDGVLISEI